MSIAMESEEDDGGIQLLTHLVHRWRTMESRGSEEHITTSVDANSSPNKIPANNMVAARPRAPPYPPPKAQEAVRPRPPPHPPPPHLLDSTALPLSGIRGPAGDYMLYDMYHQIATVTVAHRNQHDEMPLKPDTHMAYF